MLIGNHFYVVMQCVSPLALQNRRDTVITAAPEKIDGPACRQKNQHWTRNIIANKDQSKMAYRYWLQPLTMQKEEY